MIEEVRGGGLGRGREETLALDSGKRPLIFHDLLHL